MTARFAFVLALMSGSAAACPGLAVEDGWIREAPPGATVNAGYAKLHNRNDAPLTVDEVGSPAFGAAEVHRTVVEDGVSRMLRDQTLHLPPGGRMELAPGGWHLMLFRPQAPLAAGDTVAVRFSCGGAAYSYPFTIRRQ